MSVTRTTVVFVIVTDGQAQYYIIDLYFQFVARRSFSA